MWSVKYDSVIDGDDDDDDDLIMCMLSDFAKLASCLVSSFFVFFRFDHCQPIMGLEHPYNDNLGWKGSVNPLQLYIEVLSLV